MSVSIPIDSTLPDQEVEVTLSGVLFRFRLMYNGRDDSWYLSLYDSAGEPLVLGVRMVIETSLLGPYVYEGLPAGVLYVTDPNGTREDPTRDSFSDGGMALVFVPNEELAE